MQTVYDIVSRYATAQTSEMQAMLTQLVVDAEGQPTMSEFIDRAKVQYLTYLMEMYEGDRTAIADALGCTIGNVNKMIRNLQKKYD